MKRTKVPVLIRILRDGHLVQEKLENRVVKGGKIHWVSGYRIPVISTNPDHLIAEINYRSIPIHRVV